MSEDDQQPEDTTDEQDTGDDAGAPGPSRRIWWIAGAAIALVALVVAFLALSGGGEPTTSDPSDPTTTTSRVPTRVLAPEVSEIATAKESVTPIQVLSAEPPGWNQSTEAVRFDDSMVRVGEGVGPHAQDPLPTIEEPIVGRYAVDTGWEFSNPGPYDPKQPLTFLVTERRDEWAKVLVPVRPNHTEGWVRLSDVDITTTEYRIEVSLSNTQLTAYDGNEKIAETKVVIGTPFTQTPTGLFYVTDIVPYEDPEGVYGPVALATNGYSEWMNEFDTGVPVVALHGTSRPEQVGQAISNGCIRVPNDVISMLAETVPQGTPVTITP